MDNRFAIFVDDAGQPYISHAFWNRKGQARENHKYIARVERGKGRWRYFYTQQEWDAFNKLKGGAQRAATNMTQKGKGILSLIGKRAEAITGAKEKRELDAAKDHLDRTMNLGRSDNLIPRTKDGAIDSKISRDQQTAARTRVEAKLKKFYKTPFGKIAKAKSDVEDFVDRTARKASDKIDEVKIKTKDAAEKAEREIDFARAPRYFEKTIKENAKNKGISEEEAKRELEEWTTDYYTRAGDLERRDRYLEAIRGVKTSDSSSTASKSKKTEYSEYSKDDSDFDDERYSDDNRVGDTDFFSFKRDDGRTVIVEEDMKWVLPKGVDPKDPKIKSALEGISDQKFASNKEFVEAVTAAVDDAAKKKK